MTEELEKEAKDFESRKHYRYEDNDYCGDIADGIIQAYLAGAESREKRIEELENEKCELLGIIQGKDEAIKNLTQNLEDTEIINKTLGERCNQLLADKGKLTDENTELKVRIGLSIECEKAQKNGELCLGYAGDEDEPCERCKNCIKCECGYYQLGETEKYEQLNKAKELIENIIRVTWGEGWSYSLDWKVKAEQFLSEVEK